MSLTLRERIQAPLKPMEARWAWQIRGSCRTSDVCFFPPDGLRGNALARFEATAKAVCADCPVQRQCYTHAIRYGEPYGIWGGTTPQERARASDSAR